MAEGPPGSRRRSLKAKTKREAFEILRERLTENGRGLYDPAAHHTRVAELYAALKREYKISGKRPAAEALEWRWKHLEPVFGAERASAITSDRLSDYAEDRQRERASNGTINRELGALRRMFRLGMRMTPPLVFRVPALPILSENNRRMEFFEWEEFERVRAALPEYLRPLVTAAYWLDWRKRELLRLEWRRVNLKRGTVELDPGTTKNKKGRHAFLPTDALAVLKAWREETLRIQRDREIIIPNVFHRDGKPIRDYYDSWRAACKAAGVPGRTLHDFRRTAARLYVRTGTPERVAMEILGHKTRSIFDRYNVTSGEDRREAALRAGSDSVGGALGEKPTNSTQGAGKPPA